MPGAKSENEVYHVSVEHTDNMAGVPEICQVQVYAADEDQAIRAAKSKAEWPDEYHYDEDDVEVRTFQ